MTLLILPKNQIPKKLKFKILDAAGQFNNQFKSSGIAYFEVKGFKSGIKIQNATVTAKVTDSNGQSKTVVFTEKNGAYKGNTNGI